ncbi:MAG: hypothetical protein ACRDPO_34795, partial [Streptosporangiaceae bacterium]
MPASLPGVDKPIARDPSHSIVVDLPFGLRGGVGLIGFRMAPPALVLATADGHPRAGSYTSWVPQSTFLGINRIAFYRALLQVQNGVHFAHNGPVMVQVRRSAIRINIGWIVVWRPPAGTGTRDAGKLKAPSTLKGLGVRKGDIPFLYSAGFRPISQVTKSWGTITVWKRSGLAH